MNPSNELLQQLRSTIGKELEYQGIHCAVVELIEEPPCLVLQALGARTSVQENQYGSPHRLVTQVFTIPCLSEDESGSLNQELTALGLPLD